ncbi:MAG: hypothetical protein Fur0010_19100 [Bdellovibrio sp.]
MRRHYYNIEEMHPLPHHFHFFVFVALFVFAIIYIFACPTFNLEGAFNPNGPVLSKMSAALFLMLFSNKILREFPKYIKVNYLLCIMGSVFCSAIILLNFLSDRNNIFGFIMSSIPTATTMLLMFLGELVALKLKKTHILYDTFLYLSLLPVELAFIGQLSHMPYLAGVFKDISVGMSAPTQTFFGIYLILNVLTCSNMVTYQIISKDVWARKILFVFWFAWASTLAQYIFFLNYFRYSIETSMQNSILVSLIFWLMIPRLIFVFLLHHIIYVRFNLITMCSVTKQVSVKGNWLPIEKYLKDCHRVSVSHSLCPEEITKIKKKLS